MSLTVAQIDARIETLEAVKLARLSGEQRIRAGYERGMVEFAQVTLEEINAEITRLEVMRSRLTGCASGVGPIRVGFGNRP